MPNSERRNGLEALAQARERQGAEVVEIDSARDDAADTTERLVSVRASEIEPRAVRWLWAGRIPRAKLTMDDGDPGLGKSTKLLDLAARVTRGAAMPDGAPTEAGDVIYCSYEDDAEDTIVPRLLAAGGDATRLHLANEVDSDLGREALTLPEHVGALEALVREKRAALVIVDPLMAALSGEVRTGTDHHVRRALAPVKEMAQRTGAAVVLVRHLNKDTKVRSPLYRGGGSIGIIGAARAGLLVAEDPDDPERRVLAVTKSNLGPGGVPSLAFRVVECERYHVAKIEWLGESGHAARALLAPAAQDRDTPRDRAGEALRELLADGPLPAAECHARLDEQGHSRRTVARAREDAGVLVDQHAGGWRWRLPHVQARAENPIEF